MQGHSVISKAFAGFRDALPSLRTLMFSLNNCVIMTAIVQQTGKLCLFSVAKIFSPSRYSEPFFSDANFTS